MESEWIKQLNAHTDRHISHTVTQPTHTPLDKRTLHTHTPAHMHMSFKC